MYAMDALSEPGVWRSLKRTMNHSKLEIQPLELLFPFGTSALKPEPIDLTVKVILIGDQTIEVPGTGRIKKFSKFARVRRRNGDERRRIRQYSGLLHKLCEEGFPADRTAVAGIIEDGVRWLVAECKPHDSRTGGSTSRSLPCGAPGG